ncbi:MAG TPA: DUF6448 family protein [Longimicrobiales bacterium]
MSRIAFKRNALGAAIVGILLLLAPASARAHCDSMDGPVVKAAQRALETGNVNLVLFWVRPEDEPQIREAFERTLHVRAAGAGARQLGDLWFFETLVRVHRAGEGAPYTGLKPAGTDFGPAVAAADHAVESGSIEEVEQVLVHALRDGLRAHFQEVMERKAYAADDVEAGRAFVAAYVPFVHYVEGVYEAALAEAHGHFEDPGAGSGHATHP